jgi:putative ATP-dependent endonuclease of OLD family
MKITNLQIENFRSIRSLSLDLDDTTLLIGPNNAGKSAVLEAVRIALSRRWGQRGTGFTEEDVHRTDDNSDPRTAPAVRIQFTFRETVAGDWPQDMVSELEDIAVLTADGLNQIVLSIKYAWNSESEAFEPTWEFLNPDGVPLQLRRRSINLSGFYDYVWFYWLGALRDAEDEFSSRARYWGGLLKSAKIPAALEAEIKTALDELDSKILDSDPRFARIAETLGRATEIAIESTPGAAKLRMLPLDVWDMLARAGVVLRNEGERPWLPLTHHGQGLQSLSVIFLLQAAVAQQLLENRREGAEPIFAIEEPEAHLHPQAARTLWTRLSQLSGQKLVTTHSPYFVQNVPLHNLRLIRLGDGLTQSSALQRRIVSDLPWTTEVANLVTGKNLTQFSKDPLTSTLASTGCFDDAVAADLARCWRNDAAHADFKTRVEALQHACRVLISEKDESTLSFLGRRLRGEIFFARRWLLVEGQCEYLLLNALGHALDYDLDQHGVVIVDFKNNGSAGIYAALADAFGIPWNMVADGDVEGAKFKAELKKRGFRDADLVAHVTTLPSPNVLEDQLLADGHEPLLRTILTEFIGGPVQTCTVDELKKHLANRKTSYMTRLASRVAADPYLARQMPTPFLNLIDGLRSGSL